MVIVYKTSLLTYLMGKVMVKVSNIGLINIVADSRIVPELWQYDVTAQNISSLIERLLKDNQLLKDMKQSLGTAKAKLGTPGASDRAARIALEMMEK